MRCAGYVVPFGGGRKGLREEVEDGGLDDEGYGKRQGEGNSVV